MILVAGATGQLGTEVCSQLRQQGHRVRGIVRATSDAERVAALIELGVQLVEGDFRDPDSLARACAGATAVISTATAIIREDGSLEDVDGAGQKALIDAAAAAGVRHFVLVSFSSGIDHAPTPLGVAKRAAERYLMASGMTWTILRPPAFAEIWLSPMLGFDVPNGRVTIYGDGGAPVSYISYRDVAAFCVESLRAPAARNAVLEVSGPEPVTPLQAVRIAEDVTGRAMEVQHVPREALRAQYESATDSRQKSLAGMIYALVDGDAKDAAATLRVFPAPMRTVREYITEAFGTVTAIDAV